MLVKIAISGQSLMIYIILANWLSPPGFPLALPDEVKVSVDYGDCWYTVSLATALFVDNIR
jgi:hypothetical protein